MTLSPYQRIVVAIRHGIRLRGNMKYECKAHRLTTRPDQRADYKFTVNANNPSDAAREAAAEIAKLAPGSSPGFVASQNDGTFIANVGVPIFREGGLVTRGFAYVITVQASYVDESCEERPCDRCGKSYRGPAVYCSLECALADA